MRAPLFKRRERTEAPVVPSAPALTLPGRALDRELSRTRPDMTFWQRLRHDRASGRQLAETLGEVTGTMVRAQREEIQHRVTLGLDIAKKRLFQDYMETVGHLNRDLVERSTAMEKDLNAFLHREVAALFQIENAQHATNDQLDLTDEQRTRANAMVTEETNFAIDNLRGKVETVLREHAQSFEITLRLLRDNYRGEEDQPP